MRRIITPCSVSLTWGIYAFWKSFGNWTFLIPSLTVFQSGLIVPFWQMWLLAGVLCLLGALPFRCLRGYSSNFRIAGISMISFVLVFKALIYLLGGTALPWVVSFNYIMLAFVALSTATFMGKTRMGAGEVDLVPGGGDRRVV